MNINQNIIKISDISVKVIRKKIKNIHLAVYPPDGWVRVAVPEIINDEAVRLAVISKLGWIRRQQKSFKEQPRQDKRELITSSPSRFHFSNITRINFYIHFVFPLFNNIG